MSTDFNEKRNAEAYKGAFILLILNDVNAALRTLAHTWTTIQDFILKGSNYALLCIQLSLVYYVMLFLVH